MKVAEDIFNVGVQVEDVELFEGQYAVTGGMAYNSYLIVDEKVAVLDTVDADLGNEWIGNINKELNGRKVDYIIVSHMEPDHSSNIMQLRTLFPQAAIVATAMARVIMNQFFNTTFDNVIVVKENETLKLGKHTLQFVMAPMVHWPEVMMTIDLTSHTLFSADAFGKFGLSEGKENWVDEARRYYINIVGKYGAMTQNVLKKLGGLQIDRICSLHGVMLDSDLAYYIGLYDKWSSYTPEEEGILIAYSTVYGNTEKAVFRLRDMLLKLGKKVEVVDLNRADMSQCVALAFKYSALVVASTTYEAGLYPAMEEFLLHIKAKNFQKRKVGIVQNYSWAAGAAVVMKSYFAQMKEITLASTEVTIASAPNEKTYSQLELLAREF